MRSILPLMVALAAAVLLDGCQIMAPQYSASGVNAQTLRDSIVCPGAVGKFASINESGNENPISLRGGSMHSPYDDSYAAYLAEALKQDLSLAGRLSPNATIEISGELQRNTVSLPPIGSGVGEISARFIVKEGPVVRYDQVKSIHLEWDSSYFGSIAVPRAERQYPLMVQKTLAELYADPRFKQAFGLSEADKNGRGDCRPNPAKEQLVIPE
jgi:hypothetical protein